MAFPFYITLKKIFFKEDLLLIGRKWIESLVPEGIFKQIILIKSKNPTTQQIKKFRKKYISMGISLSPSFRSLLLFIRIGISTRLGYRTDFRRILLSFKAKNMNMKRLFIPPHNKYEHRSLSYIRLLTSFFAEEKNAEEYWLEALNFRWNFTLNSSEKKKIGSILKKNKLVEKDYWVICPGSAAPSKVYPAGHLTEIIEISTLKKDQQKIVLVGTGIEKKYASDILRYLSNASRKRVVDITGRTRLKELLYIIGKSMGVIANDSGIAHLTFLTKTPLITFLGMGRKEETLSLTSKKIVFNQHLECSPCMKHICPRKDFPLECLVSIRPEDVYQAMRTIRNKL